MNERSGTFAWTLVIALGFTITIFNGCGGSAGGGDGDARLAAAVTETFELLSVSPADGAVGTPIAPFTATNQTGLRVVIDFSEDFDFASVHCGLSNATFHVSRMSAADPTVVDPATATQPSGECIDGRLVQTSFRRFFWTPDADLKANRLHRVQLTTGVRSLAGTPLNAAFTSFFTTGAGTPDTSPPSLVEAFVFTLSGNTQSAAALSIVDDSQTPAVSQSGVRADSLLVALFSEAMNLGSFSTSTVRASTAGDFVFSGIDAQVTGIPIQGNPPLGGGANPVEALLLLPNEAFIPNDGVGRVGTKTRVKLDQEFPVRLIFVDEDGRLSDGLSAGNVQFNATGASFNPSTGIAAINGGAAEMRVRFASTTSTVQITADYSSAGVVFKSGSTSPSRNGSSASSSFQVVASGEDARISGGTAAVFVPELGVPSLPGGSGTTYTVEFTSGVKDAQGNGLDQNASALGLQGAKLSFQTETLYKLTDIALNDKSDKSKHDPIALAVADVDGANRGDIVVLIDYKQANGTSIDYLQTIRSDTTAATFQTPVDTGGVDATNHLFDPQNIVIDDVDADGNLDLIFDRNNVSNLASAGGANFDVVSVLRGPPTAGVWSLANLTTGPDDQHNLSLGAQAVNPNDLLAARLDSGSDPDIVTANGISQGVSLGTLSSFLGLIGAAFTTPSVDVNTDPLPTGAGNINIDNTSFGLDDVIVATTEQLSSTTATARIDFFLNTGSGALAQSTAKTIPLGTATNIFTSDVEAALFQDGFFSGGVAGGASAGDFVVGVGRPVFPGSQTNELQVFGHTHSPDAFADGSLTGNVDRRQTLQSFKGSFGFGVARIQALDFDGDGDIDFVTCSGDPQATVKGKLGLYRNMNKRNGFWQGFASVPVGYLTGITANDIAVGDLDGSFGTGNGPNDFAVTVQKENKVIVFTK